MLMVALLGLSMTMTVAGCGGQNAGETTTTETPAMSEEPPVPAEDMAGMDSTMADTTMHH